MSKLSKLAGSLIAASTLFGSTSAVLADATAARGRPAVASPAPTWSGFYFGAQAGFEWSSIDVRDVDAFTNVGTDFDSAIAGVFLGYQHRFGSVVLGVEGNWLSAYRDEPDRVRCNNAAFNCEQSFNDVLTIGGRLGWAAGHWMPYVTGGYASARFEHQTRSVATNLVFDTASARADGWYIGGGFDWAVSPGWAVGLEYRHYDFDDATGPAHTPAGLFINDRRFDTDLDTITARVSWRWDIPRAVAKPLK